jgi:hypothetical protein
MMRAGPLSNGTSLRLRTACIAPMRSCVYIAAIPIWRRETAPEVQAMKDGIHPDYHEITVVMTDGTT